jgi:hypothetical protein
MQASISEETATKVAADVRDYGRGYLRVDREGRLEHVPSHRVLEAQPVTAPTSAIR